MEVRREDVLRTGVCVLILLTLILCRSEEKRV